MLPLIDDFRAVVTQNRSLIDTRAPVEFAKGTFPNTVNLPLMSDAERELIGTTYKQKGNKAAVELGYQLVAGKIKDQRVQAWVDFVQEHPDAYLFCWRGGQRSQISQQWLQGAGITVPRLKGGYKAFRNYLMEESIRLAKSKEIVIIGGRTGSGKTLLLNRLSGTIDLEGIANHRGSSFGRFATPQPTQIDFENALSYAQIQHDEAGHKNLIIEDESRNIGRCYIPHDVFEAFQQGRVILLEATLPERIDITYDEYIIASQADYGLHYTRGSTPYSWIEVMQHNFDRIRKRLGDENYRQLSDMLQTAWAHQVRTGDPTEHKAWIRELLERYYDPMYDYQIASKNNRVVFRGKADEIIEFLEGD
jgi:tRNA 2-selenouridine synthase